MPSRSDTGRAYHHHRDGAGGERGRQHVDQRVAEQDPPIILAGCAAGRLTRRALELPSCSRACMRAREAAVMPSHWR